MIAEKLMDAAITDLMKLKEIAAGDCIESWTVLPLKEVLIQRQKYSIPEDATVPFLPMASISDGYSGDNYPEYRLWGDVRKGFTVFESNDVLVAKITPCFQNRKSTIAPESEWVVGAGTTELHVLRPGSAIFPRYLLWFVKSKYCIDSLIPKMTGTAGQKRVPRSALEDLTIGLPSLDEQKSIVASLDTLRKATDRLAELERERENLDRKFASDLRSAINDYVVTPRKEESELHKDVEYSFLSEVFEIINGDRGKNYPAKSKLHKKGLLPFVSAVNFNTRDGLLCDGLLYLDSDQYKALNSGKFKPGDFLLCIRGSLGKFCYIEDAAGAIASSLVILRPKYPTNPLYVKAFLESRHFATQISEKNNGTAQPNLSAKALKSFSIYWPSTEKQTVLSSLLKRISDPLEKLEESLSV